MPIVAGEYYHVFNRSIARQPIFLSQRDYQRAFNVLEYYCYSNPPIRFSYYNRLAEDVKRAFLLELRDKCEKQVEIVAYSLMPNHYHFLLKGLTGTGITSFISNLQNSYAKYFNMRHDRTGSLFQSLFKAVHIETDEQLIHVARYIHLNPLTSYLLKSTVELERYQWSSFKEYINEEPILTQPEILNSFFKSIQDLKKFTYDQANYQRQLDKIKHLILE
jgi:putative transposase